MFGVSFSEFLLVGLVALVAVGPQRLPGMMRTLGETLGKFRRMVTDMRHNTGIDDILREEGIDGVAELRSLLKGELAAVRHAAVGSSRVVDPYAAQTPPDPLEEYPVEGADAGGALPDDLVQKAAPIATAAAELAQAPAEAPVEAQP